MQQAVASLTPSHLRLFSLVSQTKLDCSSLCLVRFGDPLLVGTLAGSCVSGVHVMAQALRRVAAALQIRLLAGVGKQGGDS